MTTGNYDLQINWPSGRHSSAGTITDEQWGEVARILSPDWQASAVSVQPAGEVPEIKRYWLRLDDIGGHESMVRASDMDRLVAKRDARIVELERAEKNDAIAYKAALERQDELRAELAAIKAQDPVLDAPYGGILRIETGVCGKPDNWVRINPCKLYAAPVSEDKAQGVVPDEREAFEKWGETLFYTACFERHESDEYAGCGLQGAWLGWQARAAMAEPASAQTVATDQEGKPSYASQMAKRWESIMPAAQPKADPCPKCIPGTVCRTPKCGRLKAQHQPIGIDSEGGSHD